MRPGGSQETVDRPTRARQALALQLGIARQVVQDRFGPRRPLQALRRRITHLDDAVEHSLADALGRMRPRPRATVQHLGILRVCLLQPLFPLLDPPKLHAHGLGIVLLRPLRVQSHQPTQIGPRCVVYCFHDGTSWLIDFHPTRSVLFLLLSSQGYDVATHFRSRGWYPIHLLLELFHLGLLYPAVADIWR